jgi:hypothetical protein
MIALYNLLIRGLPGKAETWKILRFLTRFFDGIRLVDVAPAL